MQPESTGFAYRPVPSPSPGYRIDSGDGADLFHSSGTLMTVGVEPGHIRCCLLESVSGEYRLVGWLGQPRRAELTVAVQAGRLIRELGRRLRRHLWHDTGRTPFLFSDQPLEVPPIEHLAVTLSPIAQLRVGVLGLTAGQSTQAACEAVAGGPAHVVTARYFTPDLQPQSLADALGTARVDAWVLVGGYDHAPAASHGALDAMLRRAADALQILPAAQRPAVYFAGGRGAGVQAERIFGTAQMELAVLPNLMPAPGQVRQSVIAQALHGLYAAKAKQTPGYAELAAWCNSGIPPTTEEWNFARLAQAWCDWHGLADLHAVYWMGDVRLHVWAAAGEEAVRLHYGRVSSQNPGEWWSGSTGDRWPSVQLVAGGFGRGVRVPASVRWWDRGALSPLVAALGPAAPNAVRQVLETDILTPVEARGG